MLNVLTDEEMREVSGDPEADDDADEESLVSITKRVRFLMSRCILIYTHYNI